MSAATLDQFDVLAQSDPTLRPLAALQATAFRVAAAPYWSDSVPFLQRDRLDAGMPLLHHARLEVDAERVLSLLRELAAVAARVGLPEAQRLRDVLGVGSLRAASQIDPLVLLEATIMGDGERLERVASEVGVEAALLVAVAQVAALPLLLRVGQEAVPIIKEVRWHQGYCPLCAAWPLLTEVRGLERQRALRCGRCATEWAARGQQCIFCGNRDHRTLGYLAAEGEYESQQAVTCDECRGYLKSFASIRSMGPEALALRDMTTLELDMAAVERGYERPGQLGFPLEIRLEPAVRRFGWLPWGR